MSVHNHDEEITNRLRKQTASDKKKKTELTWEEKIKKFQGKNAMEAFKERTPNSELPFKIGWGSSSHHPERKGGITTCDIKMWCKFLDEWFIPYGHFNQSQIEGMLALCTNDNQIVALMELLSARREDRLPQTKVGDDQCAYPSQYEYYDESKGTPQNVTRTSFGLSKREWLIGMILSSGCNPQEAINRADETIKLIL